MTTVDPAATVERANSVTRWSGSGLCLNFVDWAMGQPGSRLGDNGGPPNGAWQEAKDGWYYSAHQHPGDMDPPAGVPCYWETGPSGNTAGHIVVSLGGGWCRTTDYAGAASVSTQTIASITRARVTAAHPDGGYLGWTEDFGGNPIAGITGAGWASGGAKPIQEDDMPLNDDDKKWIQAQFALVTAQYNNEISGIKGILAQTDEIEGGGTGPYTTIQSKLDLVLAWLGGGVHGENQDTSVRKLVRAIAAKLGV